MDYSHVITREQYNYLLPIYGNSGTKQFLSRVDRKVEKYYFIGTKEEYIELLVRCRYIK